MKKKLVLLLGLTMLVGSLTACEGSESAGGNTESAITQSSEVVVDKVEESSQATQEASEEMEGWAPQPEEFSYAYEENYFGYRMWLLPHYNMAIGGGHASYEPVNDVIDRAFCEAIYITQYSGEVGDDVQKDLIDMTQYQNSTDIFDLLIKNIDREFWGGGVYTLAEYSVDILETKEINGLEMTKFEGTITGDFKYGDEKAIFPVVAYGIKAKDTPVLVMCIDQTKDQSRHEIWVDKIDILVDTFRDGNLEQ